MRSGIVRTCVLQPYPCAWRERVGAKRLEYIHLAKNLLFFRQGVRKIHQNSRKTVHLGKELPDLCQNSAMRPLRNMNYWWHITNYHTAIC